MIYLHGEDQSITALPIGEDVQFATNYDLILRSEESQLRMPLMIQVALETGVGSFVLERCLGTIHDSAVKDLATLRVSFARGEPSDLPSGRVGPPVTNELDERLQYRSSQREMFAPLSLAQWVGSIDDEPVAVGDLLSKEIAKTGPSVALRTMSEATGVPIGDLVRLWREEGASLDDMQATTLADLLGVEAASLMASLSGQPAPSELIEVMNRPTQRPRFFHYAQEWQLDESQTRRRMARKLVATKRRAREMSDVDWERLLKEHFPL